MILGILYLTFQAFPLIFGTLHGFNTQSSGMSFLGIGIGMVMAVSTQPFWNRRVFSVGVTLYLTRYLDSPGAWLNRTTGTCHQNRA